MKVKALVLLHENFAIVEMNKRNVFVSLQP